MVLSTDSHANVELTHICTYIHTQAHTRVFAGSRKCSFASGSLPIPAHGRLAKDNERCNGQSMSARLCVASKRRANSNNYAIGLVIPRSTLSYVITNVHRYIHKYLFAHSMGRQLPCGHNMSASS